LCGFTEKPEINQVIAIIAAIFAGFAWIGGYNLREVWVGRPA
jgi:hypothetical protein